MSRPSFAALPSDRPEMAEEFRSQPANAKMMGCPFCRKADQLVVDLPLLQHRYATVYDVGVSTPALDLGDDAGITNPPAPDPNGVRCLNCNWQYRGPQPLARLLTLE